MQKVSSSLRNFATFFARFAVYVTQMTAKNAKGDRKVEAAQSKPNHHAVLRSGSVSMAVFLGAVSAISASLR